MLEFVNDRRVAEELFRSRLLSHIRGLVASRMAFLMSNLDSRGTPYEIRVWNLLREIAVGEMSYGALGAKLGKRDARDVTKAISGSGALSNRLLFLTPRIENNRRYESKDRSAQLTPSNQFESHHRAVGDREMTSFSPLNFYTFVAARGEFLRPDVRALLADTLVGPFSRVTICHDGLLQSVPDPESAVIRKRLDALLFPQGLTCPNETKQVDAPVMQSDRKHSP